METRLLRYFLAVGQARSISKAATALHISQPALSRQMTELEQELGTQLFTRSSRGIALTEAGYYLQQRASEIVALVDKTAFNLQTNQAIISGSLDIGAGESVGLQRIMNIVGQILKDYPAVKINLHSGNAMAIEAQLAARTLDFGIIMGQNIGQQYEFIELPERDYWGVLMLKDDELATKSVITPTDLINQPLIVSQQALEYTQYQRWWATVHDKIKLIGTYNLIFNATLLVKNRSCYALTFENLVETTASPVLTFRRLAPSLSEPITVIWPKNQRLSNVAQLFINRLQANLAAN